MAADRNNDTNPQEPSSSEVPSTNNNGNRPIFTLTMDPNALEQEIDQAAKALHSTVNSLFNTMQSSVFGGLESLHKEMSALERSSKEYLEKHPLHSYHDHFQQFPWSFRTDGPKKRYRITIEELPPLDEKSSKVLSTKGDSALTKDEDITITHGKAGTPDEGKTVITASVAPGLLDWLLFTTHDDSFFRRLGQPQTETSTKIKELNEVEQSKEEQEAAKPRIVPALVEKVKQAGTSWEKGARHWWQGNHHKDQQEDLKETEDDQQQSRRWPRGRSWGSSESYSQTTVTRADGTVEHRAVNSVNGETETVIKIHYPDGTTEETITRENSDRNHGSFRDRWAPRSQNDEDRERGSIAAVVEDAFAAEKEAEFVSEEQKGSSKSRSWPPKAWIRRQERDD
ncbi:hypothetical protein BGX27_011540 [Mortierella sp. AM989]|nr:hypothetical protein BGX27_011540 [Mortierella sp. AM989]